MKKELYELRQARVADARKNLKKSLFFGGLMGGLAAGLGLSVSIPVYYAIKAQLKDAIQDLENWSNWLFELARKLGIDPDGDFEQDLENGYRMIIEGGSGNTKTIILEKIDGSNTIVIKLNPDGSIASAGSISGPAAQEIINIISGVEETLGEESGVIDDILDTVGKEVEYTSLLMEAETVRPILRRDLNGEFQDISHLALQVLIIRNAMSNQNLVEVNTEISRLVASESEFEDEINTDNIDRLKQAAQYLIEKRKDEQNMSEADKEAAKDEINGDLESAQDELDKIKEDAADREEDIIDGANDTGNDGIANEAANDESLISQVTKLPSTWISMYVGSLGYLDESTGAEKAASPTLQDALAKNIIEDKKMMTQEEYDAFTADVESLLVFNNDDKVISKMSIIPLLSTIGNEALEESNRDFYMMKINLTDSSTGVKKTSHLMTQITHASDGGILIDQAHYTDVDDTVAVEKCLEIFHSAWTDDVQNSFISEFKAFMNDGIPLPVIRIDQDEIDQFGLAWEYLRRVPVTNEIKISFIREFLDPWTDAVLFDGIDTVGFEAKPFADLMDAIVELDGFGSFSDSVIDGYNDFEYGENMKLVMEKLLPRNAQGDLVIPANLGSLSLTYSTLFADSDFAEVVADEYAFDDVLGRDDLEEVLIRYRYAIRSHERYDIIFNPSERWFTMVLNSAMRSGTAEGGKEQAHLLIDEIVRIFDDPSGEGEYDLINNGLKNQLGANTSLSDSQLETIYVMMENLIADSVPASQKPSIENYAEIAAYIENLFKFSTGESSAMQTLQKIILPGSFANDVILDDMKKLNSWHNNIGKDSYTQDDIVEYLLAERNSNETVIQNVTWPSNGAVNNPLFRKYNVNGITTLFSSKDGSIVKSTYDPTASSSNPGATIVDAYIDGVTGIGAGTSIEKIPTSTGAEVYVTGILNSSSFLLQSPLEVGRTGEKVVEIAATDTNDDAITFIDIALSSTGQLFGLTDDNRIMRSNYANLDGYIDTDISTRVMKFGQFLDIDSEIGSQLSSEFLRSVDRIEVHEFSGNERLMVTSSETSELALLNTTNPPGNNPVFKPTLFDFDANNTRGILDIEVGSDNKLHFLLNNATSGEAIVGTLNFTSLTNIRQTISYDASNLWNLNGDRSEDIWGKGSSYNFIELGGRDAGVHFTFISEKGFAHQKIGNDYLNISDEIATLFNRIVY